MLFQRGERLSERLSERLNKQKKALNPHQLQKNCTKQKKMLTPIQPTPTPNPQAINPHHEKNHSTKF